MSDVRVIETMGWYPGEGVQRRNLHLARMERTALDLGYPLDRTKADAALDDVKAESPQRLRLTLGAGGDLRLERADLIPVKSPWRISVSPVRLQSDDPWLRIKTTQRELYDSTRAALPEGVDEVIFLNENNNICEGTITNVFVERKDRLLTPPLHAGVLPGILRQDLIARGNAEEADLTTDDLKGRDVLYVGNALRGLIPAVLI